MSLSVTKIVNLPQAAFKFAVAEDIQDEPVQAFPSIGGVFSDADHAWLASGPCLQIVNTKTGYKVGAWSFGSILQDSNTQIVCVDEIQRPHGQLPFLAVGIDCDFSGGMICIFDCVTSKIIRAVHIKDKITTLHVIDAGYDVFTLPGPLRNFDGIIAVGTAGGEVFLVDICRQICDEVLSDGELFEIRDELNPCLLCKITVRDVGRMEHHKEFAIRNSQHLAIHLNVVFDKSTKHFTLKGPKGEDRIHVDKDEVRVSALYYCPQLCSLLVGYNFGALQLYNLMNLELVYTSPVCDEHIPISHFAVQVPADDPRAVCYIWAIYSAVEEYPTCLPLAVMYAFCYQTKEYHEGYGCLYQDFSSASVTYQMELGVPCGHQRITKQRGGSCLKINSINQASVNTEGPHHDSNEDNLTLCAFVWRVWFSNKETDTFLAIFDLNQWYKEQMPRVPNAQHTSPYMLHLFLNDLIDSATSRAAPILDVYTSKKSIEQFTGAQRLEEHFYSNSLTFAMTCLRETDVVCLHNYGIQKALLAQIESLGPLCLVEPAEIYQEVVGSGLLPIFIELPVNTPVSTNQQREVILSTALENQMNGWLCKCASEWANGSFLSAGCSLDLLISWAFQRAITLKTNGDKFCTSLFDYSEVRLDNNTTILLGSCTRQLKNLHSLYVFIIRKLLNYVSNQEIVLEQYKSLETASVYFEVLQWLLNVGLLPECSLNAYPRFDDLERISAPYPGDTLAEFYNHRRAVLKILGEEKSSTSENILYIDALIENECGGRILQEQWRKDGGNGLYPPPSLQALLRTYLSDNVDLSYKHSVIIYVFLDLAMTLDQEKYKPVITQLIKFPAVFKVRPSVIKITQAFWQLDHADYNTAMGLLLDPLITSEDLSQWHHKVALKALTLQKQYHFALLYLKARKPVLKDDEDVLAAISLYVVNNMVDEAFYFKNGLNQERENKFMTHLFNECKKNDTIRFLIYRTLSSEEENNFLSYLTESKVPKAADFRVFYHVLRSRFMEAFDIHESTVSRPIENQGLYGQENAPTRDKLINILKILLPKINSNLINVCHKEKFNTWLQATRPTPMSVFVHNATENVQYKSTLIGAALAKAKQTCSDRSMNQTFRPETESTPFLRTPRATPGSKRSSAVFVNSKIVGELEDVETLPPSAKRLRLSPRANASLAVQFPSTLDTPLVKRKTPRMRDGTEDRKVATPHSILKVKSFMDQTPISKEGEFEDEFKAFKKLEYTPVSSVPKKSGLGLSPRKSLTRSPMVRFEGFTSTSSSSLDNTRSSTDKLRDSLSVNLNVSSGKMSLSPVVNFDGDINSLSKNTSTEEEIFYSPNTSLEDKNEKERLVEATDETTQVVEVAKDNSKIALEETIEEKVVEDQSEATPLFSPKGRRSYRRSLGPTTPVRSSPRLSRNAAPNIKLPEQSTVTLKETEKSEHSSEDEEASATKSSPILPKLRPRKSLCRKVLESNAITQLQLPTRKAQALESPKCTTVQEITEKVTLESRTKFGDGEETHNSSLVKKHSLTTSFVESDSDISIDYGNPETLKLSDSMMECINSPFRTKVKSEEDSKESTREHEEETDERSTAQEVEQEQAPLETHDVVKDEVTTEATSNDEKLVQKESVSGSVISISDESELKDVKDCEVGSSKHVTVGDESAFDANSSVAYSELESTTETFNVSTEHNVPKLSESMLRCINNRETGDFESVKEDDDVMEVDDDDEIKIDEEKNKSDEIVYEDLTPPALKETEKEEAHDESVAEESSTRAENKKREISDGESVTSNRSVDPEMNNFEVYDDLSFNDGLMVQKEVTLEENDLCYGQQNTLECVLEENIATTVSSTSLSVLEKNVFNESYVSEEESDQGVEEKEEAEQTEEETEEVHKFPEKHSDNEVIEIGSSSDEDSSGRGELGSTGSEYFDSDEDLAQTYKVRNIYDTDGDDDSSESAYERHYSELSENSDAVCDETKEGYGLFQGEVVLLDEEEDEDNEDRRTEEVVREENLEEKEEQTGNNAEDEEHVHTEQIISDQEEKAAVEGIMEKQEEDVVKTQDESSAVRLNDDEKKQDAEEQQEIVIAGVSEEKDMEDKENEGAVADDSTEMDELNYSISEEDNSKGPEKELHNVNNAELKQDQPEEKEGSQVEDPKMLQCDEPEDAPDQNESLEEQGAVEMETTCEGIPTRDPLDVSPVKKDALDVSPGLVVVQKAEPDILERIMGESFCEDKTIPPASENEDDQIEVPKRSTRATDILETLEMSTPKIERDVLSDLLETAKPLRVLRSRRISTEETPRPVATRRKRSASVDESKFKKETVKKATDIKREGSKPVQEEKLNEEGEAKSSSTKSTRRKSAKGEPELEDEDAGKPRSRRAKSVLSLPKIPEETPKKSKSVLEGYSMHRRVTRHQASMLQKMGDSTQQLSSLDPIVLLDKISFDGKPDPEEQKIYDVSPSTTNSTSSSPNKTPSRRLRSASQTSETSQRSKSRTPVRSVRKKSTDENQSVKSIMPKKTLEKISEDAEESPKSVEPRTTRSRARSVCSVQSDDSNATEKRKLGKRNQRAASQSALPDIREEEAGAQVTSPIPKKRTRKNSSKV